jgi:two-component system sensor histidine kinase HydH
VVKRIRSTGAWVRWGWLVSTTALGLALIIVSWANYRSARDANTTLLVGQAEILEMAIRELIRSNHGDVSQEALAELVKERQADGLRYVALLNEQGDIEVSAGERAPALLVDPRSPGADRGPGIVHVGNRVRIFRARPPLPPSSPADATGQTPIMPAPGPSASSPAHMVPSHVHRGQVIEFEPSIAMQLTERSARSLGFGLAAAALMTLAGIIFWRMSLRYETDQLRFERDRRLSSLGEMSAVLAHEIRNPLASLKGNSQLLAERLPAGSSERRKADRVILEAARLEDLTTDLLDFVRTGPLELREESPADLVRAVAEEVRPGFFVTDLQNAPERWLLDAGRMRQALSNLLRNAQQASPPDSPPSVLVSVEDGRLVIAIRDHGEGLPRGQESRIFDPFYTKRSSGTGLGLAVARRVIELHGGRLTAANHPEGGAIFRIELPGRKG